MFDETKANLWSKDFFVSLYGGLEWCSNINIIEYLSRAEVDNSQVRFSFSKILLFKDLQMNGNLYFWTVMNYVRKIVNN